MKTLIILHNLGEMNLNYLIIDGDYSRFNGVKLYMQNHEYHDEFCDFIYDEEGFHKHEFSDDISLIQNKEWDIVTHCLVP